jgi:hypothetical protein
LAAPQLLLPATSSTAPNRGRFGGGAGFGDEDRRRIRTVAKTAANTSIPIAISPMTEDPVDSINP